MSQVLNPFSLTFTGCLKCYARNTENAVSRQTMHDLHQATMQKALYLKERGFNVVEVWECDIKRELEQNEEMRGYFDNYDLTDPLEPRDAFFGGRTNGAKLFHECEEDEKIRCVVFRMHLHDDVISNNDVIFSYRYVDFTSLYPWCNKMTRTVVGHPRIITENFDDVYTYFGLVKCTVLPPRGHERDVVQRRTGESIGERLPNPETARSMAFS